MKRVLLVCLTAMLPFAGEAATVTVTREDCAGVSAHVPDDSVAYRPGVTADGRPVAPADLPGGSVTVTPPTNFSIDINVDLQERFGIPAVKNQYMGEARIGKVEIRDGKAFFDGQELATGAQNAVAEACRKLQQGG